MTLSRESLTVFIEVANSGSVTRAAASLNSTQPTISRQISRLERDIGASLFDRTNTGLVLTDAGADFLAFARNIADDMRLALECMDEHAGNVRGVLRIGGGEALVRHYLPPILARLAKRSPGLTFDVTTASEDQLDAALARRELDVIFASERPRSVEVLPLAKVSFVDQCSVFCASDNSLAGTKPGLCDVLKMRWTMPRPGATPRSVFERLVLDAGQVVPEYGLLADQTDTMIPVVATSDLLGWLPLPLLTEHLGRGTVTLLDIPELTWKRKFIAYRRAASSPSRVVLLLRQMLEVSLGENE